ncbi:MAG: type IV toxin-antitoxin system AbiEi family antitoxin [Lachnospiraceae bacterium]|nr:type IV toxin-antitoxin system AbiEi family antitoxin [Lachnospiraceae bacterium]
MKNNCDNEIKFLVDKLLRIPVIENCECISSEGNEFRLLIQYNYGTEKTIRVVVYETVTPMTLKKAAIAMKEIAKGRYSMIMAPYISEKSEQVCIENGIGYADFSGNILLSVGTMYISEKGNPNKYAKKKETANIFYASSTKTLRILRKMLEDTDRVWRIKDLATEAGCSIGMVSRVKERLCEQLWAEMTSEGLKLIDPRGLLDAWSQEYSRSTIKMVPCYTLESLPKFEKRIKELYDKHGIESCLTGLAGGSRYAPVVRYNRVHVLVRNKDVEEFITHSGCKRVESGANIMLVEAQADQMNGIRNINGDLVASPVQIFLDCTKIKGRGAEMAEAVFEKEIRK